MRTKRVVLLALASVLVAALAACNLTAIPLATPGSSTGTPAGVPVTGGTATATPSVPQLRVTSATNCRTGPSAAYDLVFTANPGLEYTIIGQYNRGGYWIVANPVGGTCWLWAQNAVVGGNTAVLPAYPAPPLNKPGKTNKLTAPSNVSASRTCTAGTDGSTLIWVEGVTLTWNPSNAETGYQVFRNGVQIFSLPAGSIDYYVQLRYARGASGPSFDTFGVQAFNSSDTSSRPSVNVARCP